MAAFTTFSAPSSSGFALPPLTGKPPEADRQRTSFFSTWLGRDVPGQQTANAFAQANNYIGAVYVSIQATMKSMAGATVKVMTRKGGDVVRKSLGGDETESDEWQPAPKDHAACKLLDYPNPTQTLSAMLAEYTMMLKLFGRSFLWGVPGQRTGKPVRLWVLSSPYVTAGYNISADYPKGTWQVNIPTPMTYGYTSAGVVWLDAREVYELRLANPLYPWAGYSPLQAGALQIDTLTAISQACKSMMDRGGTVDGVITINGASDEQLRQYKRQFDEKYTGQAKGDHIMFAAGDDVKATALSGIAPKEMAFREGYEDYTKFVSSLMGTPGQITGIVDAQSYASFYAAQLQYQTTELQPLCKMIAEHLTLQLIRPSWGPDYKLVIEPPRIDDVERDDRRYDQDKGILTVNQRLKMRNHQEIGPDGDVPEQIYLAALTAKQQAEQQAMQPQQPGGMPGEDAARPGMEGQEQPQAGGSPDDLMGGAVLSALGMDSPDASAPVQKSLRTYFKSMVKQKALLVERVPTKSGKVAAKYSGSDRIYYGKQAEQMLARTARNEEAGSPVTEGHEGEEPKQISGDNMKKQEQAPAKKPKPQQAYPPGKKPQQAFPPGYGKTANTPTQDDPMGIQPKQAGDPLTGKAPESGYLGDGKAPRSGGHVVEGVKKDGSPFHQEITSAKNDQEAEEMAKILGAHTITKINGKGREHAEAAVPKLATSVAPVAKQIAEKYPMAELIPQLKQPRDLATKFADKFHGVIGRKLGLSPDDAHELATNLMQGFARGLLMKLTRTYIPMGYGQNKPRKTEDDIRAEERGKMIQYQPDDAGVTVGRSGNPLATLKTGPRRPNKPAGVKSLRRYIERRMRVLKAFNPDEARADDGKWTSGGGGAGKKPKAGKKSKLPEVDFDEAREAGHEVVDTFPTRSKAEAAGGDAVAKHPDLNLWVAFNTNGKAARPAQPATAKPTAAAQMPQSAKAGSIQSMPVAEFGKLAKSKAAAIPHGNYNKVWLSDLYGAMKRDDPSLTFDQFAGKLWEANRDGHVNLSRANEPENFHPKDFHGSEIEKNGHAFHTILVDDDDTRTSKHTRAEIEAAHAEMSKATREAVAAVTSSPAYAKMTPDQQRDAKVAAVEKATRDYLGDQ